LLGKMIKERMREHGIRVVTHRPVTEIRQSVVVCRTEDGTEMLVPSDWVILAVGWRPREGLVHDLMSHCDAVHVIGDCLDPRRAIDAIFEGAKVGLEI
jgi:2,4-dienoyl-CoA reductase (NADPH2)